MAANKFATMVHRNTNKMTLILVYAFLEWTLIILLLLNSLFSYLIIRFADYFGLKRPCLLCSRLDHLFEPGTRKLHQTNLVCEGHATEISKLVYCFNHQKLVQLQGLCEDCSSSLQIGLSEKNAEMVLKSGGDEKLNCNCCGVNLERKVHYSSCASIKSCSDQLDDAQKEYFITEPEEGDDGRNDPDRSEFVKENDQEIAESGEVVMVFEDGIDKVCEETQLEAEEEGKCFSPSFDASAGVKEMVENENEDKKVELMVEDEKVELMVEEEGPAIVEKDRDVFMDKRQVRSEANDKSIRKPSSLKYKSTDVEFSSRHLEFYIGNRDCELIPVELKRLYTIMEEEDQVNYGQDVILDFCSTSPAAKQQIMENECSLDEKEALASEFKSDLVKVDVSEEAELDENVPSNVQEQEGEEQVDVCEEAELDENVSGNVQEQEGEDRVASTQATEALVEDSDHDVHHVLQETDELTAGIESSDCHPGAEEEYGSQNDEADAEISIGTEIPDQETVDEIQAEESLSSLQCTQVDSSVSCDFPSADYDHGFVQTEGNIEFQTILLETSEQAENPHLQLHVESGNENIEDEKIPDTPTSVDSFHRRLLLEKRDSGTEDSTESLDGSVLNDIEGSEESLTIEKLKSALRAERKALHALYSELEEERSASAVAASQTMAMINRLQEEKAAMQMEALQYQRMMEEQSEYDQEALQLLNDLMVKREKEKEELEMELELYRKKVEEYEAKENMRILRRNRTSSASCSNSEDGDGLSVDLNNHDVKGEDGLYRGQDGTVAKTPCDAVVYLEESLDNFEEERLYILEQLKALEEKLSGVNYENGQHFEDVKPMISPPYKENGNGYSEHFSNGEITGNGHADMNGKLHDHGRLIGAKPKRLLPLFDATDAETGEGRLFRNDHDTEDKRLAIEEEVDHVYERLQALEADREFLKHCINSLSKGDKGLHILQEILQHLRSLRSMEIGIMNISDGTVR